MDGLDDQIKLLPSIEVLDDLHDIFQLNISRNKFDTYDYYNIPVPRVTKILDEMINKPFLIKWAATIGYKRYLGAKDQATSIGSKVHELIEYYVMHKGKEELDINYKKAPVQAPMIDRAYNNFKNWYAYLKKCGYKLKPLYTEKQLVCPYYAGTTDMIADIGGRIYILDFKTSKKLCYDYILQLAAYKWIIDNGFDDKIHHIDGIGLIRVDKDKDIFEDLFLTEEIPYQKAMIDEYIRGFGTLLAAYYSNQHLENQFNQYYKQYTGIGDILK